MTFIVMYLFNVEPIDLAVFGFLGDEQGTCSHMLSPFSCIAALLNWNLFIKNVLEDLFCMRKAW